MQVFAKHGVVSDNPAVSPVGKATHTCFGWWRRREQDDVSTVRARSGRWLSFWQVGTGGVENRVEPAPLAADKDPSDKRHDSGSVLPDDHILALDSSTPLAAEGSLLPPT